MRHSSSEKLEIIRIVEDSELSVRQTLKELGIHRSTFYSWYRRYVEDGLEGLGPKQPKARTFWNKIPEEKINEINSDLKITYYYENPTLMANPGKTYFYLTYKKEKGDIYYLHGR